MSATMRRTRLDVLALCSKAYDTDRQAYELAYEGKAVLLGTRDIRRAERLEEHGWIRSVTHDEEVVNDVMESWEPDGHVAAILTEEGAKLVNYYLRAMADVQKTGLRLLEDMGVRTFADHAEEVWEGGR